MRIAEFASIEATNGAVRHGMTVAEALSRRGHDVTLFHRRWLRPELPGDASYSSVEIEFALRRTELRRVLSQLAELGVEVIHTHTSQALAFAIAMRIAGGPPVVASAHSQNLQIYWSLADLVISPSEGSADFQRRVNGVTSARLRIIPSVIGAQSFSPSTPERRAAARDRLGLPRSAVIVGQVGDIHPNKGQAHFLRAAALARASAPLLVAALKGQSVENAETRRLRDARRRGDIPFVHETTREDVGRFLDALDLFAMTSANEVGPFTVIEAMSAGLPIVAADVGRVREFLGDEAGIVVPVRDLGALVAAIARLAGDEDLRRRMGAAGQVRAASFRNDATAIDSIEAVLAAATRLDAAPPLSRLVAPVLSAWLGSD